MAGKLVTVYSNIHVPPVDMLKSILEEQGIICLVKGYDTLRPYLSYATGIQLQVREEDREEALTLIKETNID